MESLISSGGPPKASGPACPRGLGLPGSRSIPDAGLALPLERHACYVPGQGTESANDDAAQRAGVSWAVGLEASFWKVLGTGYRGCPLHLLSTPAPRSPKP